jgi:hypothetical protein
MLLTSYACLSLFRVCMCVLALSVSAGIRGDEVWNDNGATDTSQLRLAVDASK